MILGYRQWVNSLATPCGALEKLQIEGRDSLCNIIDKIKEVESWRLTDQTKISNLFKANLSQESESELDKEISHVIENTRHLGCRFLLNPFVSELGKTNLPNGVELVSSNEINNYLDSLSLNSFNYKDLTLAINKATASNIIALRVKKENVHPLEIIIPAISDSFSSTRILIFVEKNVNVDLLQVILGSGSSIQSHLIEIYLLENSTLNHGIIGMGKGQASFLCQTKVAQMPRSTYSLTTVQNDWILGRVEPQIVQNNGRAKTVIKGLQISKEKQQIATHSTVRFDGPEGSLNQINKAVSLDKSHCIFNGAIEVPKIAQKTDASQLSRNLLLSNLARIDTKPELQIVADDVRCSHGATVTQIQEDQLFYLQSRGIQSDQASKMLLNGFCQEITNSLPCEANRWKILDELLNGIKK